MTDQDSPSRKEPPFRFLNHAEFAALDQAGKLTYLSAAITAVLDRQPIVPNDGERKPQ